MSIIYLLAYRYILGTKHEKNISFMITICFIALAISTAALCLVLAIMDGFEQATYQQLQGIHANIIMRSGKNNSLNIKAIGSILEKEFPEVIGYGPTTMEHVLIQNPITKEINTLVGIKAIDPLKESAVTKLEQIIIQPHKAKLTDLISSNKIIMGQKLAESLHLNIGAPIQLFFVPEQNNSSATISLDQAEAQITGIFKSGIEDFDANLLFCSFYFLEQLFPDVGVSTIHLKLKPGTHEANLIDRLKKRFNVPAYSWKELYPALLSALALEKYASIIILSLMIIVASMSIISLLFMLITQKRHDIAILKSMGMREKDIEYVFLCIGLIIAIGGAACGIFLGLFVGIILKKYPLISLPEIYYVNQLPINLSAHIFLTVFIIAILLSCIATWLPIRKARDITIADALRFEK